MFVVISLHGPHTPHARARSYRLLYYYLLWPTPQAKRQDSISWYVVHTAGQGMLLLTVPTSPTNAAGNVLLFLCSNFVERTTVVGICVDIPPAAGTGASVRHSHSAVAARVHRHQAWFTSKAESDKRDRNLIVILSLAGVFALLLPVKK